MAGTEVYGGKRALSNVKSPGQTLSTFHYTTLDMQEMSSEMSRAFGHLVEWSRELCFMSSEVWSSAKLSSVIKRTHVQLEFIKL